jgi:predicted SAM-dependent methyltransferase
MQKDKKLNLGSGEFKKKGYVNVDFYSVTKPDNFHDLNIIPFPFMDNEFSLIEADHLLEHLSDPFAVMKELVRISRDKGVIQIKVPHFSRGFSRPEHKRGFDVPFPLYFNKEFKGGYQGVDLGGFDLA